MTHFSKNFFKKLSPGFTLVELLIVIAIIGLLLTIAVTSLIRVRAQGRDATRATNVQTLLKGLLLFQDTVGLFPIQATDQCLHNGSSVGLALINNRVMERIPLDPLNTNVNNTPCFQYASADGRAFTIKYTLETNSQAGTPGAKALSYP